MANDTLAGNSARIAPRKPAAGVKLLPAIDATLRRFLTAEIALLETVDPALGGFARTAREAVLAGGKRLRPTFGYWGWRGLVGMRESPEPVLPALAALELMHAFALLHDDVMDASATRRGRPTAHRVFAAEHSSAARRGDPGRFGDAAAVLAGDLCLVWADQLLATTPLPTATVFAVRACYDRMRVEAVAGQYLDILGEAEPGAWTVDRALVVARHKTASYTVQRPLQFGATLAGLAACSGDRHAAIGAAYNRYGLAVGEAFQLRDDLLGVYGDPAVTGKPAGDDLITGKPTALLTLARTRATPAQLAALDSGDPDTARDAVTATGAAGAVEELIAQRLAEAVGALGDAPIDPTACAALVDLARTAGDRTA